MIKQLTNKIVGFDEKHKKLSFYLVYTILFIGLFFIVFSPFFSNNISFVNDGDGINQHYPSLIYFSDYIKNFAKNIFSGNFILPMIDFNVGLGTDILTTLNYYSFGDPLNLLTVFFNKNNMSVFLGLILGLRMFLAGFAFSKFCFYLKKSRFSILLGTMLYIFCGFALVAFRHPYFLNPMIYLPLLYLGAKHILDKNKPLLLIFAVTLTFVSNFYFAYMLMILLVIYVAFEFFSEKENRKIKPFFIMLSKFSGAIIVGLLLSLVVFLPVIISFLNQARNGDGYSHPMLHYGITYYTSFIKSFLSPPSENSWTVNGYYVTGLVSLVLLFIFPQKIKSKLNFTLFTIFLMVPFFGYAFNGFAYVANRWIFGYAFLIAYIAVDNIHRIYDLNSKRRLLFGILILIFSALCCAGMIYQESFIYTQLILLLLFTVFVCFVFNRISNVRIKQCIVATVTIVSIALGGNSFLRTYNNAFLKNGEAYNHHNVSGISELKNLDDQSFYRVSASENTSNNSLVSDINGTSYYYSIVDKHLSDFNRSLASQIGTSYGVRDIAVDSIINNFYGTKYHTHKNNIIIPYGYNRLSNALYQNIYYQNPLMYTYDSYITKVDYENLSFAQRKEVFLQSIVLDSPIDGYKNKPPTLLSEVVHSTISSNSATIKTTKTNKRAIVVKHNNTKVELDFKSLHNSEISLFLKNLRYKSPKNTPTLTRVALTIKTKDYSKSIRYLTPRNNFYSNVHDHLLNMGYSEKPIDKLTITFLKRGTYTFDDIAVICQPMTNVASQMEALGQGTDKVVKVETNRIYEEITLDSDKILGLTIPYSAGWTATVNGEHTEILNGNIGFCAIPLKAGKNIIELKYVTPGLVPGGIISLATLLGIIGTVIYKKKKRRKPSE